MAADKIRDKYLEVLREIGTWTTVSEWAVRFGELHPDILAQAHGQALKQSKPSTGLREIAARMGSAVSTNAFDNKVEIDLSERPKRVRYVTAEEAEIQKEQAVKEESEELDRTEIIAKDLSTLNQKALYRIAEFKDITKILSQKFRLDFDVDHATALLGSDVRGRHHPDNLQILTKAHNVRKGNKNWQRFTFEEQIEYIRAVVKVQKIVEKKMSIDLDDDLIDSMIARLKISY